MSQERSIKIAIPIFNGFTALDAIGPYEVLHMLPNVEVVFVSHKPGPCLACLGMLSVNATASLEDIPQPDILLVPGGPGTRLLLQDRPLLDWIIKAHEKALYTTSVCTGSLLLAAAGLLKGLNATTHWGAYDILASYGARPTEARVVQEGSIITAAGVSAGIDMSLRLAAQIAGESTAKALQLYIEYDPQPPYDTGSLRKVGPELAAVARGIGARGLAHTLFAHESSHRQSIHELGH